MNVVERVSDDTAKIVTGNDLVVRELLRQKVDTGFFIMGGPINDRVETHASRPKASARSTSATSRRPAMMAQAYARLTRHGRASAWRASGPGTINLTTGARQRLRRLRAGGGARRREPRRAVREPARSRRSTRSPSCGPITKWAERVYEAHRIPEYVDLAFRRAMSGKPGPVYLDLPGDVLYREVDETRRALAATLRRARDQRSASAPDDAVAQRRRADRQGASGRSSSPAAASCGPAPSAALQAFVEATGIPFYTTPQGRGVIPEDHALRFLDTPARRRCAKPTSFSSSARASTTCSATASRRASTADATFVRIDIDPDEIARSAARRYRHRRRRTRGARAADGGASDERERGSFAAWRSASGGDRRGKRQPKQEALLATDQMPIHPLRLVQGGARLHRPRRDPRRRRPGDPELRPPVDPDLRARPSPQLRAVRHDGRRPALRPRRQGGEARSPGDRAARRRLVRPERAWSSTRRSATSCR